MSSVRSLHLVKVFPLVLVRSDLWKVLFVSCTWLIHMWEWKVLLTVCAPMEGVMKMLLYQHSEGRVYRREAPYMPPGRRRCLSA
jgi:hypothetical protein